MLHQQYRKAQIETATPAQLILMLYDGAIRFCALGKEAMLVRRLEEQNTHLIRAQRILGELMGSLDRELGGELAGNLFSLYLFMYQELVMANLHGKPEPVDRVVSQLTELRDSWQEAERITARAGTSKSQNSAGQAGQAARPVAPAAPAAAASAPAQPAGPAVTAKPETGVLAQARAASAPAPAVSAAGARPAPAAGSTAQPMRPAPVRRLPLPAAQQSPSTRLGERDA
jgi:flagellar protein FliS